MILETQSAAASGNSQVLAALRSASAKTGSDFDYLLSTAMRESRLQPQAKSSTSSATGLFQFIEQTWLGLVKRYGERYGLGHYADAIQTNDTGRFQVGSKDTKAAILALRKDPEVSALMAGEAAKETKQSLECLLGREVCGGELYAAHFLGQGGARRLIALNEKNPDASADAAFPQAAKANRSVFYHSDGTPKTVGEVYAWAVNSPGMKTPAPKLANTILVADASSPPAAGVAKHKAVPKDFLASTYAETGTPALAADLMQSEAIASDAQGFFSKPFLGADPRNLFRAKHDSAWSSGLPAFRGGVPAASPLMLSAGIVEILASLAPASSANAKEHS